jgi:hypothetical protein
LFPCAWWFPCPSSSLLSRLISWRWSMPFTWDTWKEIRFFIYLQWTRRERKRMLLYIITYGMIIGSLKMIDLRRCYKRTQTLCASPTKCFLYGWEPSHLGLDALH